MCEGERKKYIKCVENDTYCILACRDDVYWKYLLASGYWKYSQLVQLFWRDTLHEHMSYAIWKISPFAVCLRLIIVNCRQNEKIDEKFTVSLIIFRRAAESQLTVRFLVKCMVIYSISLCSFRLIAKNLSAYRRTEENSFLVKIRRILYSNFKKFECWVFYFEEVQIKLETDNFHFMISRVQKYPKSKKYKIIMYQAEGKTNYKVICWHKHCFYDT